MQRTESIRMHYVTETNRGCLMEFVKNIINLPKSSHRALQAQITETAATSPTLSTISGQVSNGHTEISAELEEVVSGTVRIHFSAEFVAVNGADFRSWRNRLLDIIGKEKEDSIVRLLSISTDINQIERYASQYSLAAFSYVTNGNIADYEDKNDVPFGPFQVLQAQELLESLLRLDPSNVRLDGELIATTAKPNVNAFIPMTSFAFANGKLTSFVSYDGPIVLVHGENEVVTRPGVLTLV
jgi:hypothetical protein